jgi:DNA-binding response OmpR family regulator
VRLLYLFTAAPDPRLDKGLRELGHAVEAESSEDAEGLEAQADAVIIDLAAPSAEWAVRLAALWPEAFHVQVVQAATPRQVAGALRGGADACFARPLELRELAGRLDAAARRRSPSPLRDGALVLNGEAVSLTPREQMIVELLARRPGLVLTAQEIGEAVWGPAGGTDAATVRAAISRLQIRIWRQSGWRLIASERGRGYRYDPRRGD